MLYQLSYTPRAGAPFISGEGRVAQEARELAESAPGGITERGDIGPAVDHVQRSNEGE